MYEPITSWTDDQLKQQALGYYNTIFEVECFGTRDLRMYDDIMNELARRQIEAHFSLSFSHN